jgi:hypothetical protein
VICADAGLVIVAAPDAATGTAVAVMPVKVAHWATTNAIIAELAAARVICKVTVAEVAVTAVSAKVVVVHAMFGVAIVTSVVIAACGVVVNAVVVVVVAVGNLCIKLPQPCCLGLGCFCIVCFLLFALTIWLDFGNFCFGFGGFRQVGQWGSE